MASRLASQRAGRPAGRQLACPGRPMSVLLETSKGDLELAMALGIVLMLLALAVNLLLSFIRPVERAGNKRTAASY